jgi:hypothetical protein
VNQTLRYCGRDFTDADLERIRHLISEEPRKNRAQLSRAVCQQLGWSKPDGGLKEMSCRVAMLRMHRDGLITLPEPRNGNGNGQPYRRVTRATDPGLPIDQSVEQLTDLRLEVVEDRRTSHLWNEYIQRYHYLGYQPLPGAQLRYLAGSQGQILALLGFGAAAWKIAPRDRWIGWNVTQRQQRLHLLINNARFLILPWITSPNLASKLLAMAARRVANDWDHRYGYRPVLMETFVERQRFPGTCYRAANWTHVGQTRGRGKLDTRHQAPLPVKDIWLYPLDKKCRRTLCS